MLRKSFLLIFCLHMTVPSLEVDAFNFFGKVDNENFNYGLRFNLYYGKNVDKDVESLVVTKPQQLKFRKLKIFRPIIMYVPGGRRLSPSTSRDKREFPRALVKAFGTKRFNLIEVDWLPNEKSTMKDGLRESDTLGRCIDLLIGSIYGFYREKMRIITQGLGSLLVGEAAFFVQTNKIPRIVALDPLDAPEVSPKHRLSKRSANVVEVIHTSIGQGGDSRSMGHRDFYPNGGTAPQPECSHHDSECSQNEAFKLYLNAYQYPRKNFKGTLCSDWEKFKRKECKHPTIRLYNHEGDDIEKEGNYYLETKAKAPMSELPNLNDVIRSNEHLNELLLKAGDIIENVRNYGPKLLNELGIATTSTENSFSV